MMTLYTECPKQTQKFQKDVAQVCKEYKRQRVILGNAITEVLNCTDEVKNLYNALTLH